MGETLMQRRRVEEEGLRIEHHWKFLTVTSFFPGKRVYSKMDESCQFQLLPS